MVEFYAPWCPACKDLQKAWQSLADWSVDLDIKVADVDVTTNAGLSGRFLVTALPTVYHVKDGVFRHYNGPRDKEDFISFIEDRKWAVVEPVAGWKHPDTAQMTVVAMFFRLSMSVRDLHNWLVDKQGIPPWGSYTIFALATLALGCFLGFIIVMVIDFVFPAAPSQGPAPSKKPKQDNKKKENNKKEQKKENNAELSQHSSQSEAENSAAENSADESTTVKQRKTKDGKESANASPKKEKADEKKKTK